MNKTDTTPSGPQAPRKPGQPVHSMTGYAIGQADVGDGAVVFELRTVNSRFADFHFRLSDELRGFEPPLRDALTRAIVRGKVECRMQWRSQAARPAGFQVDTALVASLLDAQRRILALDPGAAPLTVADILRWHQAGGASPGASADAPAATAVDHVDPVDALWAQAAPLVSRTIADCLAARAREGARLVATILRQTEEMRAIVAQLRPQLPQLLDVARERLTTRLSEALPGDATAVPAEETFARVRQEIALLSLRGDVAEELARLEIHLAEVDRMLTAGGAVGKRLDFLSQELNREANTLASKASGIEITDAAVSLKLLIEQMREQAQNIE